MEQSYLMLLTILIMGLFMKNDSLAIAGAALILLKLLNLNLLLPKLEAYGLKVGIIIVTIGILAPIAAGKYSILEIYQSFRTPLGVSAVLGGVLIILLTGKGYVLLLETPAVAVPILLGTILGVILFKGIPVGPLVASGVAVLIYNMISYIQKIWKGI
ncbi:Uncharacterized membrane protein, DUF441 family [Geosporobacter subterraneus DSM 17957]|uniref:UPF0756 membrane protein SAMN02745975_01780 n=1 Tax=Geosporobacter subterraneus DSM 17957 TaxID=1121919 RepID=A0A1M6IA07_9FIRM|nr:DUF441 family protein [Geosporobacter subterraneus]SHJ31283.1 Uncharacterized membrane protein, DUF441 family [Geosporobacter subterraneus DSM 17957]